MKKLLLLAVILLSSVGAFAQHEKGSFNVAPKVGLNIAGITDAKWTKSHAGFVIGVEGEYQVSDIFSVTGGLLYSTQGFKEKSESDIDDYEGIYDEMRTRAEYDDDDYDDEFEGGSSSSWSPGYLNIPILANVYVVKGLAVKAGIQPGFLINKDDAKGTKSFDFSIPVGASYEYKNIVLDARYNWGLTKIGKGSKSKNSVFQITLGYKFDI